MANPKDSELIEVASAAVAAYTRVSELPYFFSPDSSEYEPMLLALRAAYQLGSDQELDGCCHWLTEGKDTFYSRQLREARRPMPPSLKEQALAALSEMSIEPCVINGVDANASVRAKYDIIRRAIEALPDD
jgi:hypothetical protein